MGGRRQVLWGDAMQHARTARPAVVAALAVALVAAVSAPAAAAPPNRTQTPVITAKPSSPTNATTASFSFTSGTAGAVFTCQLDGGTATTCTSPFTYSGLSAGAHSFSVKAQAPGFKPSGNATATWTVDTTAPNAPSVSGPAAVTKDKAPVITFSSSSPDVVGYRCSLDGAAAVPCTSGSAVSAPAEGGHLFTVTALDAAGNTSTPTTVAWSLDTVVAAPVVLNGPISFTSSDSATFTFLSPDEDAATDCSVDGGAWSACSSPLSLSGLAVGSHTFQVRATDPAGNTAVSTPTYSWTRGVTPVTFAWSDPAGLPSGVTNETTATFAYSLSGHTTATCSLDLVPLASCASPVVVEGIGEGTHAFQLVIDQGLPTESTVTQVWVVDLVAPAAPLLSVPLGSVASKSASIGISAGAGDRLTCVVDSALTPCTSGSTIELANLAEGDHTVTVTATDRAGNATVTSATWTVDTVAPAHTVTVPTTLTGAVVVSFTDRISGAATSPSLVVAGGAAVSATRTCYLGADVVACSGSPDKVVLAPVSRLVPGQSYSVLVNAPGTGPVADLAGNEAAATTDTFRGALVQQEDSPAVVQTWRTVSTSSARGGSYVTDNRKGAKAVFTATGTSFSVYPVSGPRFGVIDVYVDGVKKASWNQYAAKVGYGSVRTIKGLSSGTHRVALVVAGRKGSTKATGFAVGIDAIKTGGTLKRTPALTTTWSRVKSFGALGYYRAVAGQPGQSLSMRFVGTGVTWTFGTGTASGKAYVYIDGVKKATIDQYSSSTRNRVTWSITGLAAGAHTIKIVPTGTKRAASKGTAVSVDALTVR